MIITIKRWYDSATLYTHETTDERFASGLAMRDALKAAVTSGASLDGASLDGASLDGASLVGANLDGASLDGASLVGANLVGASLDGANLDGASLDGANLDGASLDGASLVGASLDGANLDGANLVGAMWSNGVTISRAPLQLLGMRWSVFILDKHMQIGRELHSISDWRDFDDARIARMDGRNALRFWREHRVALLELAASHSNAVSASKEVA